MPEGKPNKGCPECRKETGRLRREEINKDPELLAIRRQKGRAIWRARYSLNPESYLASKRTWYENNREDELARMRSLYAEDPQKHRDAAKRFRLSDLEAYRERSRAWHEKNKVHANNKARAWRAANPDKVKAAKRNRRGRLANSNGGGVSASSWQSILDFHRNEDGLVLCVYCRVRKATEMDHIVPLSRGGEHSPTNVAPVCRSCNASKKDKLLNEWKGPLGVP